jgi:hypothetical protein
MRKASQRCFHHWNKHSETSHPPPKKKTRLEVDSEQEDREDDEKPSANDDTPAEDEEHVAITTTPHELEQDEEHVSRTTTTYDANQCILHALTLVGNDQGQRLLTASFSNDDFAGNTQTATYFKAEHAKRHGGVREIVSKSQFGCTTMSGDLSMTDVKYVTELAHFSHCLSKGQRVHLAKVLKLTVEKVKRDDQSQKSSNTKRPWSCVVPTTYLDIRQKYTGYPDAFLNQLPGPRVVKVGPFGYVSLRESVQNFLAYGYDLCTIPRRDPTGNDATQQVPSETEKKVSHIAESAHCKRRLKEIEKMYKTPCLVLWIIEWSDGYDLLRGVCRIRGFC